MRISKETQTADGSRKKTRKQKQKLNLMALLEQAALLGSSDVSTDDDEDLHLQRNKSYLVAEEPYSIFNDGKRTNANLGVIRRDNYSADVSFRKPKSVAQILTENLTDGEDIVDLPSRSRFNFDEKKNAIRKLTTSCDTRECFTQTLPEFPKLTVKPKSSIGLAWKEIISLSDGTSREDQSSELKEQKDRRREVMSNAVKPSQVEQISQTDLTFATDVTKLLLDNHEHEREKPAELISESKNLSTGKTKNEYPWEYIGKMTPTDSAPSRQVALPKDDRKELAEPRSAELYTEEKEPGKEMIQKPVKDDAIFARNQNQATDTQVNNNNSNNNNNNNIFFETSH